MPVLRLSWSAFSSSTSATSGCPRLDCTWTEPSTTAWAICPTDGATKLTARASLAALRLVVVLSVVAFFLAISTIPLKSALGRVLLQSGRKLRWWYGKSAQQA